MIGREETRALLDRILAGSGADQTEVIFWHRQRDLTRFANSAIYQNVSDTETAVRVRAVLGTKTGLAATTDLSDASLQRVVQTAMEHARLQSDDPDFGSLPGPAPCAQVAAFVEQTADCSPERRAREVAVVCRKALENGLVAAGIFSTSSQEVAVANSLGVFAYHPMTMAEMTAVMMNDAVSSYANACSLDVSQIDAEALAAQALDKALRSRNPVTLDPGDYEVLLEEYAVADILSFLAAHSFSGLALLEGRSSFRLGAQVMGDNVSIWDDGLSPAGLPMPFDCEGVPKRRIDLVENGIARAVVYDSTTARRAGRQSTGHGLPVPSAIWPLRPHIAAGPQPAHLFIKPGPASKEEMVQGIKKGLWVTRFNYTRLVHPLEVTVTGTTRGGTFLIENGEISHPVQNLRYTQSYREALANVTAIGQEAKVQNSEFGAHCAPALRISMFRFTGVAKG